MFAQDLMSAGAGALGLRSVKALGNQAPKAPSLLVVILPQTAADLRNAVKHFGDIVMGAPTQCIVSIRHPFLIYVVSDSS
jgi:eukaryotic translation initiation factor 2C